MPYARPCFFLSSAFSFLAQTVSKQVLKALVFFFFFF